MNRKRGKGHQQEDEKEEEEDVSDGDDSLDEMISDEAADEAADEADSSDLDDNEVEDPDLDEEQEEEEERAEIGKAGKKHQNALEKLKVSDPTFYKFLEDHDKELLDFNASDSDDSEDESDDSEDDVHKPPEGLELDSEESDFEEEGVEGEGDSQTRVRVTLKMVEEWTRQLKEENSVTVIAEVVKAFDACIQRVSAGDEDDKKVTKYRVSGSAVFNAVIQLCVIELQPALRKFMKLPPTGNHVQPNKSKKWTKIKATLKSYVGNIVKLLARVSSEHIQTVVLKHTHQMAPFMAAFPALCRVLLRRLVTLWSEGVQQVRILAFLCLVRLVCDRQQQLLEFTLKLMYVTYVRNSKFMSPSALPSINFMRRSLVEIFSLDECSAYQHVFLYIRQLAIHLRNAITIHKKETVQTVYNWQYVNSLHLWCDLLGGTSDKSPLHSLIYPLVQVIQGVVKVIPTAQYYPLRFHCARMLTKLSRASRIFIPVLPLLLDVLSAYDFNRKHKAVSMRPLDMSCVLRASKLQQTENGFKDAVLDQVFSVILEYLSVESHSIGFPDLVLPTVVQLKAFLKKCKVGNYCKKMRTVLDKIDETCRVVEKERKKATFRLSDARAVEVWENHMKSRGTPIETYYVSWNKMNQQKTAKQITNNDKLAEYDIPTIKRNKRPLPASNEPAVLFPSDDDDSDLDNLGLDEDSDAEEEVVPKAKRMKRGSKKSKSSGVDQPDVLAFPDSGDIVEEFRLSDYE